MTSFSKFLNNCGASVNHSQQTISESYKNWRSEFNNFRDGSHNSTSPRLSKPILEALNIYGLSDEEAFFILSYTAHFSSWINVPLRCNTALDKCQQAYANGLDGALSKMPKCKISTLYRMDSPHCTREQEFNWFNKNKGRIVKVPTFLSVAKSNWENTTVTWKIDVKTEYSIATDLLTLRNNPSEDEVLYQRDSLFIILGVDDECILLEETRQTSNSIIVLSGNYASCS